MTATFRLNLPMGEEGPHDFFVNGEKVGSCDHDSAGWQGMEDQRSMFENIASALGTEVQVTFDEET